MGITESLMILGSVTKSCKFNFVFCMGSLIPEKNNGHNRKFNDFGVCNKVVQI